MREVGITACIESRPKRVANSRGFLLLPRKHIET